VLDAIPETNIELFQVAVELTVKGLVAEQADSIYTPGVRTSAPKKIRRAGAVSPECFRRS
jgi:ATP-dependent DNA ligase